MSSPMGDGSYIEYGGCGTAIGLAVVAAMLFVFVFGVCLRWF